MEYGCNIVTIPYILGKHNLTFTTNIIYQLLGLLLFSYTFDILNIKYIYRVSEKTHHKAMFDFLTLKMLPVALVLIKPKKDHLLAPLVKNHPFYKGNCSNY